MSDLLGAWSCSHCAGCTTSGFSFIHFNLMISPGGTWSRCPSRKPVFWLCSRQRILVRLMLIST